MEGELDPARSGAASRAVLINVVSRAPQVTAIYRLGALAEPRAPARNRLGVRWHGSRTTWHSYLAATVSGVNPTLGSASFSASRHAWMSASVTRPRWPMRKILPVSGP